MIDTFTMNIYYVKAACAVQASTKYKENTVKEMGAIELSGFMICSKVIWASSKFCLSLLFID